MRLVRLTLVLLCASLSAAPALATNLADPARDPSESILFTSTHANNNGIDNDGQTYDDHRRASSNVKGNTIEIHDAADKSQPTSVGDQNEQPHNTSGHVYTHGNE